MDAASVRSLLIASKRPLGQTGEQMVEYYRTNAKEKAGRLIDLKPAAPLTRCDFRDGRGRCKKKVTRGAIQQWCANHQQHWQARWFSDKKANFITREWAFWEPIARECELRELGRVKLSSV